VKLLYLQYAKLEEDYGLARHAMKVYDRATKAVPDHEKMEIYDLYIARAAENFGVPKTREIYEQAIESGLPDKYVKIMSMNYADLERKLGEIDRARAIYVYASQLADPRSDPEFWNKWHEFEVQHGNEDTFREMLRIKRSVSASYSQTHFILPEYLMQKDQGKLTLEETVDTLKRAGVPEDEMAALERQLAPAAASGTALKDGMRALGFVSAGVESQAGVTRIVDGGQKITANPEDIELQEESDAEDDNEERVEVAQKDVPAAVYGDLANKANKNDKDGDDVAKKREREEPMGALERIKRLRKQ
jgi:pre-mRNA-splicing factor SYF1